MPEAFAYGLPAFHTQHTCILIQDVTEHCNLKCPTCFTASGPALTGVAPLADILANVDAQALPRGGPPRRPDAVGRGADAVPAARRTARRTGGAPDRADHGEHQRPAGRLRRRAAGAAQEPSRPARDLPAVRRAVPGGVEAPPRRRPDPVQGGSHRAALRGRHLHDAGDDGSPRRERRRHRCRRAQGPRHAVHRRCGHPAGVRLGTGPGHRPDEPAHPHRRPRPARPADRQRRAVARPDRAAVLAPALLVGRLHAQGRRRGVALAHRPRRPRRAAALAGARPRAPRQPGGRPRPARRSCAS